MKIEESTLSHLITSENIQKAYDQGLSTHHFEGIVSDNPKIYKFIIDYWTKSDREKAPTQEVINHEFPNFQFVEPEETLDWLIFELKKRYKFNNILAVVTKTADLADDGDVDAALHEMASGAFQIMQDTSDRSSLANFTQNKEDRLARYTERSLFNGEIKGAPIGFPEIDTHTFGILPAELTIAAGFAGLGKTWLLINSALSALRAGWNPYLVSLELTREDVEDRMDALAASVSHERLSRGKLSREEVDRLTETQEELAQLRSNLFVDMPARDCRTVQHIVNKARNSGSDFLLVDQLSFVQGRRDKYTSPRERYIETINDFKEIIGDSRDQKISLLVAAQFNREGKKAGKAETHYMAESSALEQVADMAFGLNQSVEQKANNAMEIGLMKFRRGPGKRWMLNWDLGEVISMSVHREMNEDD